MTRSQTNDHLMSFHVLNVSVHQQHLGSRQIWRRMIFGQTIHFQCFVQQFIVIVFRLSLLLWTCSWANWLNRLLRIQRISVFAFHLWFGWQICVFFLISNANIRPFYFIYLLHLTRRTKKLERKLIVHVFSHSFLCSTDIGYALIISVFVRWTWTI